MRCTCVVSPIETPAPDLSCGTCFVNLDCQSSQGRDVTLIHNSTGLQLQNGERLLYQCRQEVAVS